MNPLGVLIAVGMLVGLLVVGLMLTGAGVAGLIGQGIEGGYAVHASSRRTAEKLWSMALFLAGLAFTYAGAYTLYAIIYR